MLSLAFERSTSRVQFSEHYRRESTLGVLDLHFQTFSPVPGGIPSSKMASRTQKCSNYQVKTSGPFTFTIKKAGLLVQHEFYGKQLYQTTTKQQYISLSFQIFVGAYKKQFQNS